MDYPGLPSNATFIQFTRPDHIEGSSFSEEGLYFLFRSFQTNIFFSTRDRSEIEFLLVLRGCMSQVEALLKQTPETQRALRAYRAQISDYLFTGRYVWDAARTLLASRVDVPNILVPAEEASGIQRTPVSRCGFQNE